MVNHCNKNTSLRSAVGSSLFLLLLLASTSSLLNASDAAAGRRKTQLVLGDGDIISVEYSSVALNSGGPGERLLDGKIWSPGYGLATSFDTNENLVFAPPKPDLPAGQYALEWNLPAGHYTIYLQPSGKDWVLIINQNTGQAATSYSDSWDIIHAPMQKRELATAVPKLAFHFEHQGPKGGILKLSFGKTELSVPFWEAPPNAAVDED